MPAEPSRPAPERPLGLFEAYGIELEYMLVDAGTLDVAPAADWLLEALAGEPTDEHVNGRIAWNNELALHVVELKCNGPAATLDGLARSFQDNVEIGNGQLASRSLRLMPTAMHPWMDPARELRLWPRGSQDIYAAFDRIFGCKGHGWANLQSAHINLPFADDEQFARLSAAVRFVLPILPALAASSPVIDGKLNGVLDNRLAAYRGNCARIPSITGQVVPEPIYAMDEYRENLLERLYRDIERHDPDGMLRHEWLNARGAIARFERMAIEIRVLDVQECPSADLAYARLVTELIRALCEEAWCGLPALKAWPTETLAGLLSDVERRAERCELGDGRYLRAFGLRASSMTCAELWARLIDAVAARSGIGAEDGRVLEHYLRQGSLATRIARALAHPSTPQPLPAVYRQLCDALATGQLFPAPQ